MATLTVPAEQVSLWERFGLRLPHRRRMIASGDRIGSAGDPIDRFFFPLNAVFVVARHAAHDPMPLASGMIGCEGVLGFSRMLGTTHWQHAAFAVVAGDTIEVEAAALMAALDEDAAPRTLLLRYIHNYMLQLTQNTIANLGHSVERRLARWLTMFHDRCPSGELRLTHETLAMLLNVRRASVTDSLHILEGQRLVRCSRGLVVVRDRAGLQAAAGHSYGYAETDYNAAIGPFGKSAAKQPQHDPAG